MDDIYQLSSDILWKFWSIENCFFILKKVEKCFMVSVPSFKKGTSVHKFSKTNAH